jgi:putative flippase GtrA
MTIFLLARENIAGFLISARQDFAKLTRFMIVGLCCAGLFFVLHLTLISVAGWNPLSASIAAYAIGVSVAYTLQKAWSFRSTRAHRYSLPRYLSVQAAAAVLSGLASLLLSTLDIFAPAIDSLFVTLIAGAASFVGSSAWAFRDDNSRAE